MRMRLLLPDPDFDDDEVRHPTYPCNQDVNEFTSKSGQCEKEGIQAQQHCGKR